MTYQREHALSVLRTYWGHTGFRAGQEAVIRDAVEGRDLLAVLPTGGGKSLCYQLPALMGEGTTLVISPLIALMQDQVEALRSRGVRAVAIHGGMSFPEREHAWNEAEHAPISILMLSPEAISGDLFQARAPRLGITRVAVDEAHCISEWGHDFRPHYLRIPESLTCIGSPPLAAYTATAPPRVRDEIIAALSLNDCRSHVLPIDRPNIHWVVQRTVDLWGACRDRLQTHKGATVLYAGTRRNAEDWARRLTTNGIRAAAYHAGMSPAERQSVQNAFMANELRVVAATSAFGMGIDKPDVRLVLHTMLPTSLEAYYQEAGRAGRDGDDAHAVMIASPAEDDRLRLWARSQYPPDAVIRDVYRVALDLAAVGTGERPEGHVTADSERLSEILRIPRAQVDAAVALLEGTGHWTITSSRGKTADISGLASPSDLAEAARAYDPGHPAHRLITALMRAPRERAELPVRELARLADLSEERTFEGLRFLHKRGLTGRDSGAQAFRLQLLKPRSAKPDFQAQRLKRLRKRAERRAQDVIAYASVASCRRRVLREYFGERAPGYCGSCDNCVSG
ncbi:MAG: RecQ family ATP-dependent DNA helicase [Rhodothermales bacterium]|nr:RecQ family ATP-dependent DNA helicase [Rhodothermales bacterium]MBO6779658.1 RecQ family ATP-dependent DNA helicase [Rhodothermales bacterium]